MKSIHSSTIYFGLMDKLQKLYEKYPKTVTGVATGLGAAGSLGTYYGAYRLMKKKNLTELNARLDVIALSMRSANPLFDPRVSARKGLHHKIGMGKEQNILISRVISPQRTINTKKVRSMAGKTARGTLNAPPVEVQRRGDKFILHNGNHRAAAAKRAGKLKVRALVS